ncbi:MAG: hypothetical protein O7D32_01875, partial [bacterium]|nr:hypothetical protein [bacterium]
VITTAHCIPAGDWIDSILKAHEKPFAGIGGAIENDGTSGLTDWAIYFCRYSRYMLPFGEREVDDIPGDNASYKRAAMEGCKEARRNGFWEPTVHAQFAREGLRLLTTPSILVRHKKSFAAWSFTGNRFQHGKRFGAARALNLNPMRRLVYTLLSPLIPFVLLSRIARQVLFKKRHMAKLLLSLPILMLFLISWSAGELAGYLQGPDNPERTATA